MKWRLESGVFKFLRRAPSHLQHFKVLQRGRKQQKTRVELLPLFLITVHRVCLCASCFYTRPKSERERGRDALVGCWLEVFRGKKRGVGGSDRDMEGGGRVCPLQHIHSTVFVLNPPPPPHSNLTLFLFFQMQVTVKNVLVQYLHRSGAGTGR